jgi:DNA end-binding protein Ku
MSLIERKAAGEEIVAEPQVEDGGRVVDLMAALEQSLARAGRATAGSADGAASGDGRDGGGGADEEEVPPAATEKRAATKKPRARKSA